MINASVQELDYLDMSVNILKSRCMRVGRRCKSIGTRVVINGSPVDWCDELGYVGMVFKSSTVFMCNLHENNANIVRAASSILSQVASKRLLY